MKGHWHVTVVAALFSAAAWTGSDALPANSPGTRAEAAGLSAGLSIETSGSATRLAWRGVEFHFTPQIVRDAFALELPGADAGVAACWTELRPDGGTSNHYAVSFDGVAFSRAFTADPRLTLRYATFDPLVEQPEIPAELMAGPQCGAFIVQLHTQPLAPFQQALAEAGAPLCGHLGSTAVIVQMATPDVERLRRLPFVRWAGPLHPAYRLDEKILEALAGDADRNALADYSVLTFGHGATVQQPIVDYVRATGGTVMNAAPETIRVTLTVTLSQVLHILHMNQVWFVEPWALGSVDMDLVRRIGGAVPTLENAGFTGQGVRGEIYDTEVQADHPEWNGQVPLYNGPNGSAGTHGTPCYGICFSTGVVQPLATGLCPDREQGIFNYYVNSTSFGGPTPRLVQNQLATDPNGPFRSVFQTSSVGNPRTRAYTAISAETDDFLFRVDYFSTEPTTNCGLTPDHRPEAWAKNICSVGGVRHENTLARDDDQAAGCVGPALDTRINPDLIHFYDFVYTTTTSSSYTQFGGTSASSPIVAAHAALTFQMWHEGVFPGHGGGATVFDSRCKSMTMKALLMNTAYRYDWINGSPFNQTLWRDRQGWGMPDVGKLFVNGSKTFVIDETDLIAPLGTRQYELRVLPGEPELAVTLYYRDVPGNPANQAQHRVNDLTLHVISPTGEVYWGNYGLRDGNFSPPGGEADIKNTVENVFVENPAPGQWIIEVHGDEIVADTHVETPELDADYALVVRGVVLRLPGDMNCDGFVDNEDIDPFVLAINDPAGYAAAWPNCYLLNGDINGDGFVDNEDIDPFVALIVGP